MMRIPFVDLYAQYQAIKPEMDAAIFSVIEKSAFVRGPQVDAFEQGFSALHGVKHCISCANGTDSLYIAMRALQVQPGDEVITTAHSWISTSETITQAGGRVVFVDTDRDTFTLNPELIEAAITPRTKGIIIVHLYGQAADMDPILAIATRHNLWVMEDCAQAHLARYRGRLVGTMGRVGSFSFYPGKNLGAMGDAGAILTQDAPLARSMTLLARHGGLTKGEHEIEGMNSRLDGLQAAVLNVKLPHLPRWTEERRRVAAHYDRLLQGVGDLLTPMVAPGRDHVYHLYVVRTQYREGLRQFLKEKSIDTVLNYPVALPFLRAYSYLGHRPEDFPVAHQNQSRILSLPIFPEMTEAMIEYVVEQIKAFYNNCNNKSQTAS